MYRYYGIPVVFEQIPVNWYRWYTEKTVNLRENSGAANVLQNERQRLKR